MRERGKKTSGYELRKSVLELIYISINIKHHRWSQRIILSKRKHPELLRQNYSKTTQMSILSSSFRNNSLAA
jgi:hypothetical protein